MRHHLSLSCSLFLRTVLLVFGLTPIAFASTTNIARSGNVLVTVGSIHGDRAPSDKAYGPMNLFDQGEHRINGTLYDYWYSAESEDFIRLRFKDPVTIDKIVLSLPKNLPAAPVPEFSITIAQKGTGVPLEWLESGSYFKGTEWTKNIPETLEGVDWIEFRFTADKPIAIAEVELYGPSGSGELTSSGVPSLDPKGFQTADVVRTQKLRPFRRQALEALIQMKWIAQAMPKEKSKPGRAKFWYDLNKYADDLVPALEGLRGIYNQKGELIDRELLTPPSARAAARESMRPLARRAGAYGIPVGVCESTENWSATDKGFRKYLEIHPEGPRADKAVWFGPLGQGPRCRDRLDGYVENTREWIRFSAFLLLYPKSSFTNAASEKLDDLEEVRQTTLEDLPEDVKALAAESVDCALLPTLRRMGKSKAGETKACSNLNDRLEERRRKRCDTLCQEALVHFTSELVGLESDGSFDLSTDGKSEN